MFAICIESSHSRGMGHLYRALNLADSLTKHGHNILFLLNYHAVSLQILVGRGYKFEIVNLYDFDSDWESSIICRNNIRIWINDRLSTDRRHSARIRKAGIPLVTFDDRGSGAEDSQLHIAALAYQDHQKLCGEKILYGPNYLILDPLIRRFRKIRKKALPLLVTLGGSDTWGVTINVIELLKERGKTATIILGPGFEHDQKLDSVLTKDFQIKRNIPSMIEEMSHYGLAVTGGGITPFEANASGLPCLVIASEDFEVGVGRALETMGGAVFAGHHTAIDESVFDKIMPIESMSIAGIKNVGLGGICNVIASISELYAT